MAQFGSGEVTARVPPRTHPLETSVTISNVPVTAAEALDVDARAFVDDLFARRKEFLERDRFGSIGDASDFYTKIVGVTFEGRQDSSSG